MVEVDVLPAIEEVLYSNILTFLGLPVAGGELTRVGDLICRSEEFEVINSSSLASLGGTGDDPRLGKCLEVHSLSIVVLSSPLVGEGCLDPTFRIPQQRRFNMGW